MIEISDANAKIITYVFAWYALFLAVCGTIANLFASFVCFHISKVSTFRILSILFIFKAMSLYTWNLDIFLKWFMPFKGSNQTIHEFNVIESFSLATCKFFTFIQYYSLQMLSWLMAYVSIDQVIKVYLPRIPCSLNPKNVYKICFLIAFVLFLVNLHILIFNGKVSYTMTNVTDALNVTSEIEVMSFECYNTNYYEFFPFWDNVHLYLYGFGPFSLTLIANCMISYKVVKMKSAIHNSTSERKKRRLMVNILFTSILFILMVTPVVVAFGYYFITLSRSNAGTLLLYFIDLSHFTFNSFISVIYYQTNSVFRKAFRRRLMVIYCSIKLALFRCAYVMGCIKRETLDKEITNKELMTSKFYKGQDTNRTATTSGTRQA